MAASFNPRNDLLCYVGLPLLVFASLGLAIGLTYAPCYSSLCVETYFPLQTRIHISVFYGMIVVIAAALWARRHFRSMRRLLEHEPRWLHWLAILTGKGPSLGGLMMLALIAAVSFATIAYWYPAQRVYWMVRGQQANWTAYMFRVVWTGVTGHWIDLWIGLVILPVCRNSVLGRVFDLHSSTLLFAHKILAYSLLIGGLVHGFLYYSFLGAYVSHASNEEVYEQFNPDNPELTWHEAEVRGIYSWFVLPTGALVGLVLVPIMAITSLPLLRRMNYNVFYYIHVILAALVMIVVCLHASINFYCLLPGLFLWLYDWTWRTRHSLANVTNISIEAAGNGWYRIRIPNGSDDRTEDEEKQSSKQFPESPLLSYYINIPGISRVQLHAFTAASRTETETAFLFRRSPEKKNVKQRDAEWTWRLAAMADGFVATKPFSVPARIEGPYITRVPEFFGADHIMLLAGGTGITGALALANSWLQEHVSNPLRSLRLMWSVRDQSTSRLREIEDFIASTRTQPNVEVFINISEENGRVDPSAVLEDFVSLHEGQSKKFWVYASGPAGLLKATETACVEHKRKTQLSKPTSTGASLEWYTASFEV